MRVLILTAVLATAIPTIPPSPHRERVERIRCLKQSLYRAIELTKKGEEVNIIIDTFLGHCQVWMDSTTSSADRCQGGER